MKRLTGVLLILVIVIAALVVIISAAASAGEQLSGQEDAAELLEPQITNGDVLYVKPAGSGDCTSWAEACQLQSALADAVSGDEIWVAEGVHRPQTFGLPLTEMTDFTFVTWVKWAGGEPWQRIYDFGQDTNHFMMLTPKNRDGRTGINARKIVACIDIPLIPFTENRPVVAAVFAADHVTP